MANISPTLQKHNDETFEEWKFRIITAKVNKEIDLDWIEIRDILGLECSPDTLRKAGQGIAEVYQYYKGYGNQSNSSTSLIHELDLKIAQLQKERSKLQSAKLEVNKWIREQGRNELIQESFIQAIEKLQKPTVPTLIHKSDISYDVDPILAIADQHYGKECVVRGLLGEVINEYNPEEFEKRMWFVLEKVVNRLEKDRLTHINIANLGDAIDGVLRASQLQKIRMGAIDQTMQYANFMVYWLNELSKYARIDYFSVLGNHSETRILNSDRGEFDTENLERIINWFLQSMLKDNPNITIHDCGNHVYQDFVGVKTLMIHGQYDKNLEHSIRDYMIAYGQQIDLVLSGHLHHNHTKTIGINGNLDVEFIQCPSFCGVDDYSMRLKRASKAAVQMHFLERDQGVVDTYKIKLN